MDKCIGFDIDSKKKVACVVQKCKPITNRQRPLNPFAQNLRLLIKISIVYLIRFHIEIFKKYLYFRKKSTFIRTRYR